MEIELTNGKGLIQIGVSKDEYSYFKYHKPLSVVWWDNQGSIGQFLIVTKDDNGFRNTLNCFSKDTLYSDFTGNLTEAYTFIKPLLELFENGKYIIAFTSSSVEKPNDNPYYHWGLHIPPYGVDTQNFTEQIRKHREFLAENEVSKRYYPSDLLVFSTYNFSDYVGAAFIATQPKESIDPKQVAVYKKEILDGKKPFAIVAAKGVGTGTKGIQKYSPSYVLDGHHKILAYQELKMHPAVLQILSFTEKEDDLKFDLEEVKDVMFPWQYEHLSKHYNWDK